MPWLLPAADMTLVTRAQVVPSPNNLVHCGATFFFSSSFCLPGWQLAVSHALVGTFIFLPLPLTALCTQEHSLTRYYPLLSALSGGDLRTQLLSSEAPFYAVVYPQEWLKGRWNKNRTGTLEITHAFKKQTKYMFSEWELEVRRHSYERFCLKHEWAGVLGYKDNAEGCDGQERTEVLCPGPSGACSVWGSLTHSWLILAPVWPLTA